MDASTFSQLVAQLPLGSYQRTVIMVIYLPALAAAETAYTRARIAYIISTTIITVASVVIVALIPLDKMVLNSSVVFWINFSFSLALAMANKFMHAFSVGHANIFKKIYLEKLRSEGWAFVSGVDRYATDIDTRFNTFCGRIEHLRLKSLEIESNSGSPNEMIAAGSDKNGSADVNTNASNAPSIIHNNSKNMHGDPHIYGDHDKNEDDSVIIMIPDNAEMVPNIADPE